MKIYSKFKDYYDHITGFYSNDIIWERTTRQELFKKSKKDSYLTKYSNKVENLLSNAWNDCPKLVKFVDYGTYKQKQNTNDFVFLIGLCGKLYPAFIFYEYIKSKLLYYNTGLTLKGAYIDLEKFLTLRKEAKKADLYNNISYDAITKNSYINWMGQYHQHPDLMQVFIELNTPIFIIKPLNCSLGAYYDNINLLVSPCMDAFKLQASFDPYTVYQEIEMFLSNQLVITANADIKRTDELIRDSKGMDKWSFRQKGPKVRKRK